MTRTYTLQIEGGEGSFSAHIPELSSILVTGGSMDELVSRAKEAVALYWDEIGLQRSPTAQYREIEVELSA